MTIYTAFARAGFFNMVVKLVDERYGNISSQLDLPKELLQDPMRLMPISEIVRYVLEMEKLSGDELFIARACSNMSLHKFPSFERLIASAGDLFTAMQRLNHLLKVFESGAVSGGKLSGKVLKWHYDSHYIEGRVRLHSGIFACFIYISILRLYHGEEYEPLVVRLPGGQLGNQGEIDSLFGCKVEWHASSSQVWIPLPDFSKLRPAELKIRQMALIDQDELLKFLDMPESNDFLLCVYELINYSRLFSYPKLEQVANFLRISPQQLQRKLQSKGIAFSTLVGHQLLCNQALKMLSKRIPPETIAQSLGFTNSQSFTKAFKRMHGLTPRQYLEQQEHYQNTQ